MAYRRRQGNSRSSTFEDFRSAAPESESSSPSPAPPSLAAAAIRASSAHRDSSISSAYGESAIPPPNQETNRQRSSTSPRVKIWFTISAQIFESSTSRQGLG